MSIDDINDDLLEAMLDLEYNVEKSFNWNNYQQMGLMVAIYLSDSPAQKAYKSFMTSPEIVLGNGTYCARDMAPVPEVRARPFILASRLAERQMKHDARNNGRVEPVISRLAEAGFVGISVTDATDDPSNYTKVDAEKAGIPCRMVAVQTPTELVGVVRFRGESKPTLMTPQPQRPADQPCPGCLMCDLGYLVRAITARA